MRGVSLDRFEAYFRELHNHPPYPWQRHLAARIIDGEWPAAIDLPTGCGKTACLDIAVFALACQADCSVTERTAPRRVFFCVNRRVIVDEAHRRATRIARAIWDAEQSKSGDREVLRDVAAALRLLSGTKPGDDTPPLDVLELRGGIYRDNRWARSVTQPTIVCTTLDQLGSRLLFRGYGVSPNAAPIQAALIAYDSLVLLDEAHISEPFRQTLHQVTQYLDPSKWAEETVGVRPLRLVPMTATPPEDVKTGEVVRLSKDDRDCDSLSRRLAASKPAELREAKDIARACSDAAIELAENTHIAVGVIVNRVATAKAVHAELRKHSPDAAIELVIGSMRPVDRDEQAKRLDPLIGANRPTSAERTSFVIATQCLEVGADYDFDALVTECASLDALRQRFGRLNRAGRYDTQGNPIEAQAVILVPSDAMKPKKPDPIYGDALPATWQWLWDRAECTTGGDGANAFSRGKAKSKKKSTEESSHKARSINFGIDAFTELLKQHGEGGRIPRHLLAPSASLNAPVMLPAYVDFWCQTAPRPQPDPDVALFIHGPQRGEPDVQVCWRADLGNSNSHPTLDQWCDVVALLPPTAAECMSVPISRVRRWLTAPLDAASDHGDLLGVAGDEEDGKGEGIGRRLKPPPLRHVGVLWRGTGNSILIQSPSDLHPGDTFVVPMSDAGGCELGHLPGEVPQGNTVSAVASVDRAEQAMLAARARVVVRIHPTLRSLWPAGESVDLLFQRLADVDKPPTVPETCELLSNSATEVEQSDRARAEHLRQLAKSGRFLREYYPDRRGVVLIARRPVSQSHPAFLPALDDGEDEPSRTRRREPILLDDHTSHVLGELSRHLHLQSIDTIATPFLAAARLHDLGKADERFQAMLMRAGRTEGWLLTGVSLPVLAKSDGMPQTKADRDAARLRAGLPAGFRHEMLSMQLAEQSDQLPADPLESDLALHLIAAHHGHARPFAPVVLDDDPPDVEAEGLRLSGQDRLAHPVHRLDSGVAERFWSLTHHFGWWGLAFLEAMLRLADQRASAAEDAGGYEEITFDKPAEANP